MFDFFGTRIRVGDEILYPRSNHTMMFGTVLEVGPDYVLVQREATSDNRWCRTNGTARGARTLSPNLKPYRLTETYAAYVLPPTGGKR